MADANKAKIRKMYDILSAMINCAMKGNKEKTLQLNELFRVLFDYLARTSPMDILKEYDNCRQSCLLVFMIPDEKDRVVADIVARFSRIPKP